MSTFPAERIKRMVQELIEQSSFYREHYAAMANWDWERFEYRQFAQLPILEREHVLQNSHRLRGHRDVTRVHFSGGTLGKAKSIYYTPQDWERAVASNEECLRIAGLSHRDRVAILQPFGAWSIGQIYLESVSLLGAFGIPLGIYMDDRDAAELIVSEGADILMGAPGNLCRLARRWQETEGFPPLPAMRLLILAGEAVQPGQREYLEQVWQADVRSLYGSAETDSLGVECGLQAGLHLCGDDVFAEVITAEGPRELEAGLEGDLIVTTLQREGTPLLRYRLGDHVRVLSRECACGQPGWTLEFLGRKGQTISFQDGTKLYADQVYRSVEAVLDGFLGCQVILTEREGRDRLECVVYCDRPVEADILRQIEANIKRSSLDVGDVVAAGLLESVQVRTAPPDQLVLNHRGKSVLFTDLRTHSMEDSRRN